MKKSITTGIAAILFASAMGISGPAAATSLGVCGPANQGQVKSRAAYYSNGMLRQYYEFTCYDTQWEMTFFLSCDAQGNCINLS